MNFVSNNKAPGTYEEACERLLALKNAHGEYAAKIRALSSETKCNTPRRFDIGKVAQDLKECCHAIVCASVGG